MSVKEWLSRDLQKESEDRHRAKTQKEVLEMESQMHFFPHGSSRGLVGLALSGGGIRSATFSLGVIQALARAGKLASFGYMSSVSGGGYIGSWLSAWIHRSSLTSVQEALKKSTSSREGSSTAEEPDQLKWLRSYSNYLAPRLGLLSQDSLTLIAIWLRNFLLNLIVFVAFAAALLMLPRLLLLVAETAIAFSSVSGSLAATLGIVAFIGVAFNLAEVARKKRKIRLGNPWLVSPAGVVCVVAIPMTVAILLTTWWLLGRAEIEATAILPFAAGLALILGAIWCWHERRMGEPRNKLKWPAITYGLALIVAMPVAGGGLVLLRALWDPLSRGTCIGIVALAETITFGPVAILAVGIVSSSVFVGIVGREYFERSREWWARFNALVITATVVWLTVCVLSFYAWPLVEWGIERSGSWMRALVGAGWLGSVLAALFAPARLDRHGTAYCRCRPRHCGGYRPVPARRRDFARSKERARNFQPPVYQSRNLWAAAGTGRFGGSFLGFLLRCYRRRAAGF